MRHLLLSVMIIATLITFGQDRKRILIESNDEVISEAIKQLDEAIKAPAGEIYLFQQEQNITGKFTFDITIHEKGYVATVFVVNNDGGSIDSQNKLKDFIKDFRFWFKMPKGKDYKFQYVFNFN